MKNIFVLACLALAFTFTSCSDDETPGGGGGNNNITGTIWSGAKITFTKANGSDPSDPANQDRITDNVIITRDNSGGQIYNVASETSANKNSSPAGTRWALGRTSNVENLTFSTFRGTIEPKDVVGEDMVMHLVDDDIYVDIKFVSWTQGKQGGFSYERSTE
ncbi:MAG: hypothetical protein HKN09_02150 [Saprospiraceae bacterium]|nr:hypothetical protein [Saprospiraceae bacterium]